MKKEINTQLLVLGGGPAGYSAAFRAADLGMRVVLVNRYQQLGGVCLNVGCIPSKALLHIAKVVEEAKGLSAHGIHFAEPKIDLQKIKTWKEAVINQPAKGLQNMSKQRNVQVIHGTGKFTSANSIIINSQQETATSVVFDNAIIATGSRPTTLDFIPYDDKRIWDSTDALALKEIPKKMLVIGGGIIGLEMATVYYALGSEIDIVEFADQLIPAADKNIVNNYYKQVKNKFNIMLATKVVAVKSVEAGLLVNFAGKHAPKTDITYDVILLAIGRKPNSNLLDADKAGVDIESSGFINACKQQRTNIEHIYAIGDIVGEPMLAHKGAHQGHIAAEVIAGKKHYFDPKVIPNIAYTEPEVAWTGLTEKEASIQGIKYKTAIFPWAASGRAIAVNASAGMTKLIFNQEDNRLIGGAIVGTNAGELLGELSLAIEMGSDAEDIALTVHAHPTLYETIGLAAEVYEGTVTDMLNPKAEKL